MTLIFIPGLLDTAVPLLIHEEVFDRLPISACSQHFEYVELRTHELTKDLQPGKGKGLTLLRFCIELVRRLSKPTREHTIFVGRILSLLSSVFPLGERSGVNSRGDFNIDNKTTWEALLDQEQEEKKPAEIEEADDNRGSLDRSIDPKEDSILASDEPGDVTKAVPDEELIASLNDSVFYELFWKAQAWFANPSLLFNSNEDDAKTQMPKDAIDPLQPSLDNSLKTFRTASQYILNVLGAVGRREKELEGKADTSKEEVDTRRSSGNGQDRLTDAGSDLNLADTRLRKRKVAEIQDEDCEEDDNAFFPKYLTDRNLFEYELRDASFRRHILAQYIILFQYLLGFTETQKEKTKDWKNQLIATHHIAFTLEEGDEKWIRDTWKLITTLIRDTSIEGKEYNETLLQVLRREARWIQWKADSCPSIDQVPMKQDQWDGFTRSRSRFLQTMRPYPHKMGTAALSRLWEDGVRRPEPTTRTMENEEGFEVQVQTDGLDDLEFAPTIPTLQSYAAEIIKIEGQQELRRKELDWETLLTYAIIPVIAPEKRQREKERLARESGDDQLQQLEQSRVLNAWRAARLARSNHLDSFARIKVENDKSIGLRIDDITGLMRAIDDRSKALKRNSMIADAAPLQAGQAASESVPTQVATETSGEDVEMNTSTASIPSKTEINGKNDEVGITNEAVEGAKSLAEDDKDITMQS